MRRGVLLLAMCGLGLAGCKRHDMYAQGRSQTWDRSRFFPNGLSMRPPAPGAVPVQEDDPDVPQPAVATEAMLARGEQRFDIFCTPCHGRTGDGNGMIVQRGFPRPPSFHTDRLRDAKAAHFYDVITNGYGVMYSYASRVPSADRWAVIAYVRALQRSQGMPAASLTDDDRAALAEVAP